MSNYIRSEGYRLLRNKSTYFFIVICTVLLVSSNIVLAVVKTADPAFPYATTAFSFSNVYFNLFAVYALCIFVSTMVFSNEYSNNTLKNSISYGISRKTIYFGKLMVQIIYSIISFGIILGAHILSGYLLLENSGSSELHALLRACAAGMPLFIFALSTATCFSFLIENTNNSISATTGVLLVFPLICNLLGRRFVIFEELSKFLPSNILTYTKTDTISHTIKLYWDLENGFLNCFLFGLIQIVLITFIGLFYFQKKEIK